jgi:hypothetical protein
MTPYSTWRRWISQMPFKTQVCFKTRTRRAVVSIAAGLAITLAGAAGVWAAFQGSAPQPQLTAMVPQGALLTIEAKDFSGLLTRWTHSPEKSAWLKSDSYSVFSRSRLFGRLGDAQNEFAQSAGLPPDMSFLKEVAGGESVFAWYDIGKLEFLYITRMPQGSAEKTRLVEMRGKISTRQAGSQTFYVRTQADPNQRGEARTVAFATSGDWLLLATREDLIAGALMLMAANSANSNSANPAGADSQTPHPLSREPWFVDAHAAAAKDPGELRMTLNLDKIVPSPYFRSYWVQRNITEMKQYRSAVADLYTEADAFREERVLLPKTGPETAASGSDLATLTALLPQHAGVYRAAASPGVDAALDTINEKLLRRAGGSFSDRRMAPEGDVQITVVGAAADLDTRIDAAPVARPAMGGEVAQLRQALTASGLTAMMTVTRTGDAVDGIWVPFQSAVALSSATDWDAGAMQSALQQALQAHLTAGGLGLLWKPVKIDRAKGGSYFEISDSRPLELAVRGKVCILADNAGLMEEMLSQLADSEHGGGRSQKSAVKPESSQAQQATLIAGFDLPQERNSFARWSGLVDRTNLGSAAQSSSEPSFFSQNMGSLGQVFAALESERVVERKDGALTRQTVTYAWKR